MQTILCPVDFSELSARALQLAGALARCSRSRLAVVHATHFEAPPYFTEGQQESLKALFHDSSTLAREALHNFVKQTLPNFAEALLIVEDGVPAEVIHQAAKRLRPVLIVAGTHSEGAFSRILMGSVAEQLLRTAAFPVLTLGNAAKVDGPPRKILVAVNHTAAAREAVAVAASMAQCIQAELTLLEVDETGGATVPGDVCEWVPESIRQHCTIRARKQRGEASNEILRLANEGDYGMVVVGARHRLFHDTTVLGGTTVKVIRHARVPVLTVFERSGS